MGYYVNRAMCIVAPVSAAIAILMFVLAIWSSGPVSGKFGGTGAVFAIVAVISSVAALSMYNEVRKPYSPPKIPKERRDRF